MATHDSIGDFLTIIRNASKAGKESCKAQYSKLREGIASILKDEGYIAGLKKVGEDYAYKNAADTKVMWNEEGAMLEQLIKDLGYYMQNKRK